VVKIMLYIVLCAAVSGCGVARTGVKTGVKATKTVVKTTASMVN
jgi:hypothetical protein